MLWFYDVTMLCIRMLTHIFISWNILGVLIRFPLLISHGIVLLISHGISLLYSHGISLVIYLRVEISMWIFQVILVSIEAPLFMIMYQAIGMVDW